MSDLQSKTVYGKISGNTIGYVSDSFKDIQIKYGVFIPPTQPKYGVVQPAYGVPIPYPVQPKYGVFLPDIDITYSQLEENISTLKKAIANLKDSWSNETKKNIAKLDNSWVGPDCAAYTEKLTKMDSRVQKTISALELLCTTYEKARDMVKDSQNSAVTSINNIQ